MADAARNANVAPTDAPEPSEDLAGSSQPDATNASRSSGTRRDEYVVVARRYRPQNFAELVGQDVVSRGLCNALTTDRVGHAYLFTGARGVGKTSTARILAKSLNCVTGPTTTPCGQCDICQQIASGEDVDVLEIDGASNRGIDEIRQLRANVGIRPSRARFKVYIIDEVHMLTKEAFNALLKTLEEPPDHVKFIFCTTEPGKIPVTVLSRCQRFDFAPVMTQEIVERLKFIVQQEGAAAEPAALELLARRAAGSMRDSQSLLEQLLSFVNESITVDHVHAMLGTARDDSLQAILAAVHQRDAAGALAALDQALREGVDAGQLAEQLVGSLRDLMVALVGGAGELLLYHSPTQLDRLKEAGQAWGLPSLLAAAQILDQAIGRMRVSVHGRILLELALIRITQLEDLTAISGLVQQLIAAEGPGTRAVGGTMPRPSLGPATGDSLAAKKKMSGPDVAPPLHSVTRRPDQGHAAEASVADDIDDIDDSNQATNDHPGRSAPASLSSRRQAQQESTANAARASSSEHEELEHEELEHTDPELADATDQASVKRDDAAVVPEQPVDASPLTPAQWRHAWSAALESLNDMTADYAGMATDIASSGPNRLVVRFQHMYNSSKSFCERPERRQALEQAVSQAARRIVRLDFELLPAKTEPSTRTSSTVSRQQQRQQLTRHPFVERAMEMFAGEIMHVDAGRGREKSG